MTSRTPLPIRQLMVQALCSPMIGGDDVAYMDAAIDKYDADGTSFSDKAKRIAKDVLTRERNRFADDARLKGGVR